MKNTIKIIHNYFEEFPGCEKDLLLLKEQIKNDRNFFNRKNFTGHIVANALIINDNKILTIFHNTLQMYIQPGGHVDDTDVSVIEAAKREVFEEVGIKDIELDLWHEENKIPIFIESHLIPENAKKQEVMHYHHDFMYIFKTNIKNIKLQLEEVSGFNWVDMENVLLNSPESFIGKSLKRWIELK